MGSTVPIGPFIVMGSSRLPAGTAGHYLADLNQQGVGMSIKVIVELKAKPGQRDALVSLIERMITDGPPMPGSLIGSQPARGKRS
jgi:hypothetical protein